MHFNLNRLLSAAAALALLAGSAAANDGFAGVTATGLEFQKTDKISMETEDLRIGIYDISVAYTFKNTSNEDVTGTVVFPMPPVSLSTFLFSPTQMTPKDLDAENPLNFTAMVDGKPVAVKTDRRAYLPPPYVEPADPNAPYVPPPAKDEYEAPGEDITDYLTSLGIPIVSDPETVMQALDKLPADKVAELKAKGYAEKDTSDNGPDMRWMIGWSIGIRHYWDQTFPAGATLKIEHAYKAFPSGGLFYWYNWTKPTEYWDTDPNAGDKKKYCIDDATSAQINKALPEMPDSNGAHGGTSYNIAYILTTAKTWKGPIGKFRLTVDKGSEKNAVSFCMDGVTKTGPTTFTVEKTNFSPDKDLEILIVTADPAFKE